jgi:hypothetical protein
VSLFTINADFGKLVAVLGRIADGLDRAYPKPKSAVSGKPAGPENLTEYDAEAEWRREQEEEARQMVPETDQERYRL